MLAIGTLSPNWLLFFIKGYKMGYLEECQTKINQRDFPKFLELWEEYCTSDTVDIEECVQLLETIKNSDFAKQFGKLVETALPLWRGIADPEGSYQVGRLLIDLQTTNTTALHEMAIEL